MVHCRYAIATVALRFNHEGKEWCREETIKCHILKDSVAKKGPKTNNPTEYKN